MPHPARRAVPLVAAAALLTLTALTGCAGGATTPETPESGAVAPAPTPTPTYAGTAVGVTCADLFAGGGLAAALPGYALDPSFAPMSGSSAALAVSIQGAACGLTSPVGPVSVGLAKPDAASTRALEASFAASGTPVPSFGPGVTATFDKMTGQEQLFTANGVWISVQSSGFTSAETAQPLLAYIAQALPSG